MDNTSPIRQYLKFPSHKYERHLVTYRIELPRNVRNCSSLVYKCENFAEQMNGRSIYAYFWLMTGLDNNDIVLFQNTGVNGVPVQLGHDTVADPKLTIHVKYTSDQSERPNQEDHEQQLANKFEWNVMVQKELPASSEIAIDKSTDDTELRIILMRNYNFLCSLDDVYVKLWHNNSTIAIKADANETNPRNPLPQLAKLYPLLLKLQVWVKTSIHPAYQKLLYCGKELVDEYIPSKDNLVCTISQDYLRTLAQRAVTATSTKSVSDIPTLSEVLSEVAAFNHAKIVSDATDLVGRTSTNMSYCKMVARSVHENLLRNYISYKLKSVPPEAVAAIDAAVNLYN